jgi:hypothetical protein
MEDPDPEPESINRNPTQHSAHLDAQEEGDGEGPNLPATCGQAKCDECLARHGRVAGGEGTEEREDNPSDSDGGHDADGEVKGPGEKDFHKTRDRRLASLQPEHRGIGPPLPTTAHSRLLAAIFAKLAHPAIPLIEIRKSKIEN